MKEIWKHIGAAFLSVLFLFSFLIPPVRSTVARAESNVTEFERTNVMDDLGNSEMDGKPFEFRDYAFNSNQSAQVLMLVEYCYSFYANRQGNFGLYLYVWNPQGLNFRYDSELNKVQLSYEDDADYVKYPLKYLNRCERENYEGLFYKYKIDLSIDQRSAMLEGLNSSERVYHVSGIELIEDGKTSPQDYSVNAVFKYSGYAKGYGANTEAEDTLAYSRTSGDVFVIEDDDLHQTFYRPTGTDGSRHRQDTLHTVYFTVPNTLIKKYGRLAVLRVQWLEAVLNPFLVTGNQEIFNALKDYVGQEMGAYAETGFAYGLLGGYEYESTSLGGATFVHKSAEVAYNPWYAYLDEVSQELNRICLAFNSGNKTDSADSYTVGGETLLDQMKEYSRGSSDKVLETYDRNLFVSVASEFTVVDIPAEKEYSLTSEKISQTFWEKLTGKSHVEFSDTYNNIQAIYPVSAQDFGTTKEHTCQNLYIDLNDYDEFRSVYDAAVQAEETMYLFRFAQSKYSAWEVTEGKWTKSTKYVPNGITAGGTWRTVYHLSDSDTNAYFGQETVYLGLDLIQMEWDDGGKRVVIPIVSSPIDVAADGTPPVYTTSDVRNNWWKILFGVIALIVIIVLLLKFAPWLIYGIGKVIAAPFKALSKACKSGRERRREKREKKKFERKGKKARKQVDKEFDKFHKKCEREEKEVQKNWKKVDVESLKRKIWSGEKSEMELTKTERYALNQDEDWLIEKEIEEVALGFYDDDMDWWME